MEPLPERGTALYAEVRAGDLEGVVGKWTAGTYQAGGRGTSWVKVRSPDYSQMRGRREVSDRPLEGVPPPAMPPSG
jgi:hypothetical protein